MTEMIVGQIIGGVIGIALGVLLVKVGFTEWLARHLP